MSLKKKLNDESPNVIKKTILQHLVQSFNRCRKVDKGHKTRE